MEKYALAGWIRNSSDGVELEAEGLRLDTERFIQSLKEEAPSLSRIDSIAVNPCSGLKAYKGIVIRSSQKLAHSDTLISPDTATCLDCLQELFDPADRRFRYPFINCTNCGPRFSIIRDLPYDRPGTTMAVFPMCSDCAAEYDNITDRRYHAQPNCCATCGPELFFLDGDGQPMEGDPLANAAQALRSGRIIAVKGLGGIHLACRIDDPAIVQELRRRKRRDEKPFALMCRDTETARRFCRISPEEKALLSGHIRPILLLEKNEKSALPQLSKNGYLGVMLPYAPVHHLLFAEGFDALVMTSANLSDQPILIKNEDAAVCLRGIADGFLLNNREIENRCDDSLLRMLDGAPYFLRRSRGYAPMPLEIDGLPGGILACGAEQKASFCLSRSGRAFPSAHIGDLKNAETLLHYTQQIRLFERMFDQKPEIIACDLHPDYLSTDYARSRAEKEGLFLLPVQHHHAHMASCMADNCLDGDCIGLSWDGAGLGTDNTIWGGEFLTGGYAAFERRGSIRPIRLPGGDRAVKEIWRIGASLLLDAGIDPAAFFPDKNTAGIRTMLEADLNCPAGSSMGRLFDGVSAILGLCRSASYEGQGAVLLEAAADDSCAAVYPFDISSSDLHVLDYRPTIAAICSELNDGVFIGTIAAKFMNTLVKMAAGICALIRRETKLDRIMLSGGVFQNMYLLGKLRAQLEKDGFRVYRHRRVSANDEGISLGQLAIAAAQLKNERTCSTNVPCSAAENH